MTAKRAANRALDDGGSLAVEYVIVAPIFLLLLALIFAYGRVGQLDGLLDAGTRDAARAVSQAPDLTQAHTVALRAIQDELGSGAGGCSKDNVTVTVVGTDADTGRQTTMLAPGDTVLVTATCRYSLADLGLPVPLPAMTASSVFASVIDPNRTAQ